MAFDGLAEAVGQDQGALRRFCAGEYLASGIPEQRGEFIAADPGYHVARSDYALHQRGDCLENLIAARVAVRIVIVLEVVDVEQQQRGLQILFAGAQEYLVGQVIEIPPVVRAGKMVGDG